MRDTGFYQLVLFLAFCGMIFLYDYLFRRVPNNFLIIAVALQLGCLVLFGQGLNGVAWPGAFLGFVIGLAFFMPLYALRAMAAGDVKFFAVLGLLLGPGALLPVFLMASLIASVHALVFFAARSGLAPSLQLIAQQLVRLPVYQRVLEKRGNRVGIPYAAYMALAGAWLGTHHTGVIPGFT